jgi:hypothetical protein
MLNFYFCDVREIKEAKRPELVSYLEDAWAVDTDSTWSLEELRDCAVNYFAEEEYQTNSFERWYN